jgi:hypothetical protein
MLSEIKGQSISDKNRAKGLCECGNEHAGQYKVDGHFVCEDCRCHFLGIKEVEEVRVIAPQQDVPVNLVMAECPECGMRAELNEIEKNGGVCYECFSGSYE